MKPAVLIIDDEKDLRNLLSKTLELEGNTTITASNGKEALKILPANDINFIRGSACLFSQNLTASSVAFSILSLVPFSVLVIALFHELWKIERETAWLLLPYVI